MAQQVSWPRAKTRHGCTSSWQMKPDEVQRNREHWRTRAEVKQPLGRKKEEAWEFFRRQPGRRPKTRHEFEHEFKRRVTYMLDAPIGSGKQQENYLQEWTNELHKRAQEEDQRLESRERKKMEQEHAHSQRRQKWDKMRASFTLGSRHPFPSTGLQNAAQRASAIVLTSPGLSVCAHCSF